MKNKLWLGLICVSLVLGLTGSGQADLVARYEFESEVNHVTPDTGDVAPPADGTIGAPALGLTSGQGAEIVFDSGLNSNVLEQTRPGGVDCGYDPKFDITGGITIVVWARQQTRRFVDVVLTKGGMWGLQGLRETAHMEFYLSGVGRFSTDSGDDGPNDGNEWHHYACVYNPDFNGRGKGRVSIYVDASVDEAYDAEGTINTNERNFIIATNETGSGFGTGAVDSVGIYNQPLTSFEIGRVLNGEEAVLNISQTDGVTFVEEINESSDTFIVSLTSAPSAEVSVTVPGNLDLSINGGDPNDSVMLTFGPGSWDTPQTVTVAAVNDDLEEEQETVRLSLATASGDLNFDNGFSLSLPVIVGDDDAKGVFIDTGDGVSVTEGGETDTYTVVLLKQPSANVTVSLQDTADPNQLTFIGMEELAEVVFTSADWDTPQTINVGAIDDDIKEDVKITTTIRHAVASNDEDYNGLSPYFAVVTIQENDCGAGPFVQADLDRNCEVGLSDVLILAAEFLNCSVEACD